MSANAAIIIDLRQQLLTDWIPLEEVAAALRKHPRTVRSWKRHGYPVTRIGREFYVHRRGHHHWMLTRANIDPGLLPPTA